MKRRYNSFKSFLTRKFPGKSIRKIPVNAGFSCPNKDGTISSEGCIFCDVYGSGPIKTFKDPIEKQIEDFIRRHPKDHFIAYYQANSNTAAPVEVLRSKYEIALKFEKVLGLFIGTRPDCIANDVYPLLESVNGRTYLAVELGLQSIHEKSLTYLNRNHTYGDFLSTFEKLKKRDIDTIVHLIVGITGETIDDMVSTVEEMNRIKPAGVKLHLFHVLKGTKLFRMYESGNIRLPEMEEYTDIIVRLLELLDPEIVVHRLTGERDREIFHAPLWALEKNRVIEMINRKLENNGTFQGKKFVDQGADSTFPVF